MEPSAQVAARMPLFAVYARFVVAADTAAAARARVQHATRHLPDLDDVWVEAEYERPPTWQEGTADSPRP
jgi:hypothetical protein